MHQFAKDIMKNCPSKIDQKLCDEIIHQKYHEVFEYHNGEVMPRDFEPPTKQQVINWVKKYPEVITLDMNLLLERFFFDLNHYRDVTQAVHPVIRHSIEDSIEHYRKNRNQRMGQHRRAFVIQEISQITIKRCPTTTGSIRRILSTLS